MVGFRRPRAAGASEIAQRAVETVKPKLRGWLLAGTFPLAVAAGVVLVVLSTPGYIALGWAAVFYLPDCLHAGGLAVLLLLLAGAVLYSVGGVVYAAQRPNPSPRWFGFHEVFHAFTLAAFLTQYTAVSMAAYTAPRA